MEICVICIINEATAEVEYKNGKFKVCEECKSVAEGLED
jgi:hypothetical protein